MPGPAARWPASRVAALFCLVAALSLGWLAYGRYLLAVVSYSVPQLNLGWDAIRLPQLQVSGGVQPATLEIDKIHVQAPIARGVSSIDQEQYDAALKTGVALAAGSAPLEAPTGNSFIFGHSSNFSLRPSPYDTVFALLPRLGIGDTIKVASGGQTATYAVTLSKSIAPTDIQYLVPSPDRQLTLVTCWPAGTTFRRWVVQAVRQ